MPGVSCELSSCSIMLRSPPLLPGVLSQDHPHTLIYHHVSCLWCSSTEDPKSSATAPSPHLSAPQDPLLSAHKHPWVRSSSLLLSPAFWTPSHSHPLRSNSCAVFSMWSPPALTPWIPGKGLPFLCSWDFEPASSRAITAVLAAFWHTKGSSTSSPPLCLCPWDSSQSAGWTVEASVLGQRVLSGKPLPPLPPAACLCAHGWEPQCAGTRELVAVGSGLLWRLGLGLCWRAYFLPSGGRGKRSHNLPWNTPSPHAHLDDFPSLSQVLLVSLHATPRREGAWLWNQSSNKLPKVAQARTRSCTGEQPLARSVGPGLGHCGFHPWKHLLAYPFVIPHPNHIHPSLQSIPRAVVNRVDESQF